MDLYNEIAKALEDNPASKKYDEHVKRLLSIKIILAHILIGCIEEFAGVDPYEVAEKYIEGEPQVSKIPVNRNEAYMQTITGMNTEDSGLDERTVRYDILFYAYMPKSKETVKFIINIEAQTRFNPGYSLLKRAVYYCARMISAQYTREFDETNYDDIKKVFSIWLCSRPSADKRNTVTRFSLKEKNLIGKAKYNAGEYDLLEVIMVCLGGKEGDENYKGIVRFLDKLTNPKVKSGELREILRNDYKIKLTTEINREVLDMCNLSYGLVEAGMLEGIEKGLTKGKAEGREEKLVENLKNLMKNLGLSLDDSLKALSVPEGEYGKYRKLVLG